MNFIVRALAFLLISFSLIAGRLRVITYFCISFCLVANAAEHLCSTRQIRNQARRLLNAAANLATKVKANCVGIAQCCTVLITRH